MYHYFQPGRGDGSCVRLTRGDWETQRGDQGLSVISCFKFIDKLVGQTIHDHDPAPEYFHRHAIPSFVVHMPIINRTEDEINYPQRKGSD